MARDRNYIYSQPYTLVGGGQFQQTVQSPFGMECEVAIGYYSSSDANGILAIGYDTVPPVPTELPSGQVQGFLGNILKGAVTWSAQAEFIPIYDALNISGSFAAAGDCILTLYFRRVAQVVIPREETKYYGD